MSTEHGKAGHNQAGRPIPRRAALYDCLFLSLVVLLSLILYICGLGFYSDDWFFLWPFATSGDQSLSGLYWNEYTNWWAYRPLQKVYWTVLYWLFGPQPLGYHLTNALVLNTAVVLFYLSLRKFGQSRLLAVTIPLVWALLPHYSTGRFWFTAFQGTLSMAFYFLSLYSGLKALQARRTRLLSWKLLSFLSMFGSILVYEITLPLFLFNLFLIRYRRRELYGATPFKQMIRANSVWLVIVLLLLIVVSLNKTLTSHRMGANPVAQVVKIVKGGVTVSFGDYGLGLPRVVWVILRDYSDPTILAVGAALGLVIFGYLYGIAARPLTDQPGRPKWPKLITTGLIVFGLGYAIFLVTKGFGFTTTGINNRTAIAAAAGVAAAFTGGVGWGCSLLPSDALRKVAFCALTTFLCVSGFLINNTIASFWVAAYRQEREILADIREHFSALPSGSTFVLDGVCPYVGPAIVFESSWDLEGALRVSYHDPTLKAIVVTPNLRVQQEGISMLMYDYIETRYPYAEHLFIYHFGRKVSYRLTDAETASRYFQTYRAEGDKGCPPGREGYGVPIF